MYRAPRSLDEIEVLRHSQCTANPLNPPYQGDFGTFATVGVIGKCLLIFLIHYSTFLSVLWGKYAIILAN